MITEESFFKSWRYQILGALLLITTIVSFALVEIAIRFLIFPDKDRSQAGWARAAYESNQNAYLKVLMPHDRRGCTHRDIVTYHPDFGSVYNRVGSCRLPGVNRQGFRTYDFPFERRPEHFSILVLGGSVADSLAARHDGIASSILEVVANEGWTGPQGENIRILDGAIGGARLPTQERVLMRFGRSADAVLALDGANEVVSLRSDQSVDEPEEFMYLMISGNYPFHVRFFADLKAEMQKASSSNWLDNSALYQGVAALIGQIAIAGLENYTDSKDYDAAFGNYFRLPKDWNEEKIVQYNVQRYIAYIQNFHDVAARLGIPSAHFLQPIAATGKRLTSDEAGFIPLTNFDLYRRLETETRRATKGLNSYSLLDVFKDHPETIYADPVHPLLDTKDRDGGYYVIAKAILEKIGKQWGLRRKKP